MKSRKFLKRSIVMLFALVLTFCAMTPTTKAHAMEGTTRTLVELRFITEDGVRLRKEGNPYSTILGLMYTGDPINYYSDQVGQGWEEGIAKLQPDEQKPDIRRIEVLYYVVDELAIDSEVRKATITHVRKSGR